MRVMRLPRQRETTVPARPARAVEKTPLHLLLVLIAIVWLAPTVGLLVSSFRPPNLVSTSGWWHAFGTPFQFTLDNYQHVLDRNNMERSFVNSLFVAIPATVMPIMIAA